ncbi:GSCOCG00008179001-RA-CDS [Cotesia congregata]|nr:GSCOCG00008179001-RA-CDS [Cotesia congregata]
MKNEEVQCGKCNEKFLKSRWSGHNLSKHNNTGWLNGSKEPNIEGNEKLWKKVLGIAIKKKKGSLICDKCNEVKRSVSGFISHYKFCGKSEEEKIKMMWICPLCKGVFMPSSVDFHERTHRQEMTEAAKKSEAVTINDDIIDGKRKRKAAEKATGKILEFTKIVRDEPPAKKRKTSKSKLDELIEKPLSAKKLPNVWKGKWAKDIAANRPAKCRQPSCTFSANTLDEICAHFRTCNFTPQTEYICKICKFFSKFNDIIVSHVKSVHSDKLNSEDSDFDVNELTDGSAESDHNNYEEFNEDVDNPKNDTKSDSKKGRLKVYDKLRLLTRAKFLRNAENLPPNSLNITYTPSIKWTLQFELDNYKSKLFENLLPNNFNLLTNSQAQDYLPELKVSMKTKQMKNTSQNFEDKGWKSFKLFESAVINNVPTFFVGGPVWALAWLPIPIPMYDPEINQYLAVSTHPTMENKYPISQSYKFKNIIQIWNMGHLDHVAAATPTPKLAYIVTHNNGTIWCMEWCPSGSYHHSLLKNDSIFGGGGSLKRMGLLATASSDGNVHIYSLPFPEELNFNTSDDNDLPIYQTDPVVTLHLNRLLSQQNKADWQCTSLSWSKLSGHDTIAAGFSNGYVALWDLISKSPLLITKNVNTIHMNAFQHFYAHGHAVTYVGIVPVNGKNFLATTSLDRCTKVWDLEDPYYPVDNVKKGAGTNGAWMTHWLNTYTSYDDALGLGHTVSYMMAVRDSSSGVFPLLPTNSTTYGLAVSDYANGICHGTLAGDVTAIFPFQLFYIKDIDKLTKKRWLVSSIELVDFGENTQGENNSEANINDNEQANDVKNMPETYDACKDRFGIVYHDDLNVSNYKTNLLRKINRRNPVNSETMNTVPLEQYQFTSVNRLAWNQNSWSYLWVAAGYQNGLIRIFNLKSMSVHNAVGKLLPDHAKSMMHKFNNEQSSRES